MNDYLLSFLLGVIEGLTEYLPVSSTAHLRITEALLGIDLSDGYWKMFSIVIQLGAILCLPIYFHRRIKEFLVTFPKGIRGDRTPLTHPLTLTLLAFVCTAVPSLLVSKIIGKHLESLPIMGASLIAGGVIMWVVDARYGNLPRPGDVESITPAQAVWIGLMQTLAPVFPGTSRSMATITAGELAGLSRTTALEFSFLLSIPTMVAATGYDLLKFIRHPEESGNSGALHFDAHGITILAIGFAVSFFVAWGVVAWFMHWVRKHGFVPFAIYRLFAGAAVLAWAWK
ncbi:MAG: Undecaprenyl-diphosphatase [Bryobacteraceae bacterium]|nr:Undecaprenyl-diphosphatase [Bryobacteraceae bacterium]MCC6342855.1 undecaprenyl-diphosphate phosphatase [Bryobacterales bacterium]